MELTLITMLSKTKKVFTTYLPVLCSIASRNYYNGNVEVVEAFITICAAGEGGGMEITMKKTFAVLLSAIVLCSTLLPKPTSAAVGWDRQYFSLNGADGWVYCSEGVAYNPASYAASVEDDIKRDFAFYFVIYPTAGGRDTLYTSNYAKFLYHAEDGIPISSVSCTVYVDDAAMSYHAVAD